MPSTVANLLAAAGTTPDGVVRWGATIPPSRSATTTGVYAVALTADPHSRAAAQPHAPVDAAAVRSLLKMRPELRLDGHRPTADELIARLSAFWCADEVVLYVGLAGPRKSRPQAGELSTRVSEYHSTELGARGPHAGGWPLKTLACLPDLFVHYAYCDQVALAERRALSAFADGVSQATRATLHDRLRVMPFANLEFPKGVRKAHGITGARAPEGVPARVKVSPPGADVVRAFDLPPSELPMTQPVTAADIAAGRIRIPRGKTKLLLPGDKARVEVRLVGQKLPGCRWDPRRGPDQERSGVIGIGRAAASELLVVGERLEASVDPAGTVMLDRS